MTKHTDHQGNLSLSELGVVDVEHPRGSHPYQRPSPPWWAAAPGPRSRLPPQGRCHRRNHPAQECRTDPLPQVSPCVGDLTGLGSSGLRRRWEAPDSGPRSLPVAQGAIVREASTLPGLRCARTPGDRRECAWLPFPRSNDRRADCGEVGRGVTPSRRRNSNFIEPMCWNCFCPASKGVIVEAVVASDGVSSFVKNQAAQPNLKVEDFFIRGV